MIELLIIGGGIIGLAKGLQSVFGGGGPKTPDGVDKEERAFLLKNKNDPDPSSMRRYLDWKRHKIGMPRRPGVNADLLAPRNDADWTIKPGEQWNGEV